MKTLAFMVSVVISSLGFAGSPSCPDLSGRFVEEGKVEPITTLAQVKCDSVVLRETFQNNHDFEQTYIVDNVYRNAADSLFIASNYENNTLVVRQFTVRHNWPDLKTKATNIWAMDGDKNLLLFQIYPDSVNGEITYIHKYLRQR